MLKTKEVNMQWTSSRVLCYSHHSIKDKFAVMFFLFLTNWITTWLKGKRISRNSFDSCYENVNIRGLKYLGYRFFIRGKFISLDLPFWFFGNFTIYAIWIGQPWVVFIGSVINHPSFPRFLFSPKVYIEIIPFRLRLPITWGSYCDNFFVNIVKHTSKS
jgi:hypothetical protein